MKLVNKIAIITGSGQGLGKVFARNLLKEGSRVCISDINEEVGRQTAAELIEEFGKDKVHFIQCDVTKIEDLTDLYDGCEEYFNGKVDIFCNNAGINHVRGWKLCMEIDIMAVMAGTELAMNRMDMREGGKGGLIVNTASLAGIVTGFSRESASYFAAKHGVVSLTRTLGHKKVLQDTGVKVQCICPSFAETAIISDLGPGVKESINSRFGIMTPEFVGEGFIKLIKYGGNGAALAVAKDCPPFFLADYSKHMLTCLGLGAMLMHKLFGIEVFTVKQQMALLLFIFCMISLFIAFIF